jgi:hypothetical protein
MGIISPALFYSVVLPVLALAFFTVAYFSAVPSTLGSYEPSMPSALIVKPVARMPMPAVVTPWCGQYAPWEIASQSPQISQQILQEKEARRLERGAIYVEQVTTVRLLRMGMIGLL